MIQLLIDSDTLLELILGRYILQNEVKELEYFLEFNSIDLHITQYGLDKFCKYLKRFTELKEYKKITRIIKKRLKILSMDTSVDREALRQPLIDFESAIEVAYASKNQIGAIITHKPSDFSGTSLLQVLTIEHLKMRNHLEEILALGEQPEIISIASLEEIEILNRLFMIEKSQIDEIFGLKIDDQLNRTGPTVVIALVGA